MAVMMAPPRLPAPAAPPRQTQTLTRTPSVIGYGPNSPQSQPSVYPGVVSPYGAATVRPGIMSPYGGGQTLGQPNPNQMNTGFGAGGMQAPQTPAPYKPYMGATYGGRAMATPIGQANAMTWQSIGNMLGVDTNTLNNALMRLTPLQQGAAAKYAQQNLGLSVPGDGLGVTVTRPAPVYNQTPVSSPMGLAQFNSRFGGIQNLVNQRLGR